MIRSILLAISLSLSISVQAQHRVWMNFSSYAPIQSSVDYFPVIRLVDSNGNSFSNPLVVDDLEIHQMTQITTISFLSVDSGNVQLLGGDWFILDAYMYTWMNQVIFMGIDEPLTRFPLGITHISGAPIMVNVMHPQNLWLQPGHYYIGFRTVQSISQQAQGMTQILSYSNAQGPVGWTTGAWSPDVDTLGNINYGFTFLSTVNFGTDLDFAAGVFGN